MLEYGVSNTRLYGGEVVGSKINAERILVKGAGFFPDSLVITRSIISIEDTGKMLAAFGDGLSTDHVMGVRTIAKHSTTFGDKLPWAMGIDGPTTLVNFFTKTLPEWKHSLNPHITHLILMNNPPEVGIKETDPKQFVARLRFEDTPVSVDNIGLNRLILDLMPGTNQLRGIDEAMRTKEKLRGDSIQYTINYDPVARRFTNGKLTIGTHHLKESQRNPTTLTTKDFFPFHKINATMSKTNHYHILIPCLEFYVMQSSTQIRSF